MLRPQANACRAVHDLDGTWLFRLDPADEGRDLGWPSGLEDGIPIGVPGSWNDQVPGARDELGPAWYERRFEPPPVGGRETTLRFGSVVYAAEVWLNGERLGEHEGGHLPFALACSEALREGENVLVVRVDERLGRDRLPPGLVPHEHTHGREFHPDVPYDFFPFPGIHHRVELVATPRDGIRDLRLDTALAGGGPTVSIEAEHGEGELGLRLDGKEIASPNKARLGAFPIEPVGAVSWKR
jgi:beta-glucuronidase